MASSTIIWFPPPDQDGDGLEVGAVLDDDHPLLGVPERDLPHGPRHPQLLLGELLEAGDDPAPRRDGDVLDLHPTDPSDGRQAVLKQEVVGLVVEPPLADDKVGPAVLHPLNHIPEVLLLLFVQLLVRIPAGDIELVLGLGLGRLEGAGEDAHLCVLDRLGHLGVGDVLVDDDAVDELGVLEGPAGLALHPDHVEVDIVPVQVGDVEDRVEGDLGHLALVHVDDLGAEGGHGSLDERLHVVAGEVHGVGDVVQMPDGDLGRLLEALSDPNRVNPPPYELLGLLEQRTREHHDASGAVPNLVVLRRGQLHHELPDLVRHLHLAEDGGPVVGDGYVPVGRYHDLVHPLGTQRRADDAGDGPRRQDVGLGRLCSLDAGLGLLLLQDHEGPAVFVCGVGEGGGRRQGESKREQGGRGKERQRRGGAVPHCRFGGRRPKF